MHVPSRPPAGHVPSYGGMIHGAAQVRGDFLGPLPEHVAPGARAFPVTSDKVVWPGHVLSLRLGLELHEAPGRVAGTGHTETHSGQQARGRGRHGSPEGRQGAQSPGETEPASCFAFEASTGNTGRSDESPASRLLPCIPAATLGRMRPCWPAGPRGGGDTRGTEPSPVTGG